MSLLYLDDSYVQEFVARVVGVFDQGVVLDDTAFYPTSGGQPHDTGLLVCGGDSYQVVEVRKRDGQVVHVLDRSGLLSGSEVRGIIDWSRRYALMRAHTASHVMSAVMHEVYGVLITGNQLTTEYFRVDFSLEQFDRALIDEVIARTNELLALDVAVSTRSLPRSEALLLAGVVKLAGAFPPHIEVLRIVTIGSDEVLVDQQADGGTHVRCTGEVGQVELVRAENKGRANRRVYVRLTNTK